MADRITPISLEEYIQSYRTAGLSISQEMLDNAITLISRVNRFMDSFGERRSLYNGWKPAIDGNPNSRFKTMQAIAILDYDGDLDQYCMDNQKLLEACGLWAEHPATTRGWCHLQCVPPKSGRRIFYP